MRSNGKTIAAFISALLLGGAAQADPVTSSVAPSGTSAFPLHASVHGTEITTVELGGGAEKSFTTMAWGDLSNIKLAPGTYSVRFDVAGGDHVAIEMPPCAGRTRVMLDGVETKSPPGPVILQLPPRPERAYEIVIEVSVGGYEHRIACGFAPRFGAQTTTREGLSQISFSSPSAALGGGKAVVFIPPGHDLSKRGALLVGLHPWSGTPWTYANYAELLHEASVRDVVLLMPSGLGNSLYTANAEDEVFRALDALELLVPIDPKRISLWGASMGGAGATTIGFHNPDRFATVTSFFGDSKYDISTYVKSILPTEAAAHAVNALDIVENARNLPVWLIHGEDDHVSSIAQSTMLAKSLQDHGFAVQLDRVPHAGHEGAVVAKYAAAVVDRAATATLTPNPARVSYRSVRASDTNAYGVRFVRSGGDAFVDLERRGETIYVLEARGVKSIDLVPGAFGTTKNLAIVFDGTTATTPVHWSTP
ncbi:MAG: prolyl oligopeptidase family serine peptidase [Polyangiaceae bacterium]